MRYFGVEGNRQHTKQTMSEELSYWLKRHLSAFEEKFVKADKDKNGSLCFSEISALLREAGFKGTEEDLQAIFRFADTDNDRKISRSEYVQVVKQAPKIKLQEIVLRRAFKKLDKDGSGFLSRDEIIAATQSQETGLNIPSEKLSGLLVNLVTDADGKISYEEFLEHFHYDKTAILLRELFNKIDTDKSGFLTKKEIVAAIKADEELSMNATKLSQLLIAFSKEVSDKINYEEFASLVAQQAKK